MPIGVLSSYLKFRMWFMYGLKGHTCETLVK